MDFALRHKAFQERAERGLVLLVPDARTRPGRLHTAMLYSLEAGGKRLRPVLAQAAAELFPGRADPVPAAVALECVHTYSLIHDDLPCMDNDDLRRGRPTAHKAFDEATALLAGDALLAQAFFILGHSYEADPALAAALVRELGEASGSRRLVGGQMADLLAEKNNSAGPEELEFIHLNKTAAMIEASLVMGGLCGGAERVQGETLRRCGRHLGMAFQIVDDILDVTADCATLGKTPGKDLKAGKTTCIKLHGLDGAKRLAHQETAEAQAELAKLPGDTEFLVTLLRQLETRIK
jgi:geranylgeranyl pyrophosphate synthase